MVKESTCQCKRHRRHRFHLWVGRIPWRRKWQPIPIFLPGKFHGEEPGGLQSMGSQNEEEPGGLQSMGSQRVGHD